MPEPKGLCRSIPSSTTTTWYRDLEPYAETGQASESRRLRGCSKWRRHLVSPRDGLGAARVRFIVATDLTGDARRAAGRPSVRLNGAGGCEAAAVPGRRRRPPVGWRRVIFPRKSKALRKRAACFSRGRLCQRGDRTKRTIADMSRAPCNPFPSDPRAHGRTPHGYTTLASRE